MDIRNNLNCENVTQATDKHFLNIGSMVFLLQSSVISKPMHREVFPQFSEF